MSHPYRISVSHSVTDTVYEEDYTQCTLELTPLLSEEEMKGILEKVLEEKGWTKTEEKHWEKQRENGERMEVDIENLTVTTTLGFEGTIEKEKTVSATGDTWNSKNVEHDKKRLEASVREKLEKELEITESEREIKRNELGEKASQNLAKSEDARNREINEILVETYAEALQEKAKSMGEITEISEQKNEKDYELTIKIKA
jgi:hypothetical protein